MTERIAHIEDAQAKHAGRGGAFLPWKAELRIMLCGEVVRMKAQPAFSVAPAVPADGGWGIYVFEPCQKCLAVEAARRLGAA